MIPDFVHEELNALGVELTATQLDLLARYLDLLFEANQRMNLTAVKDRATAWRRLILDSLTLLPGLPASAPSAGPTRREARVIDVGAGGGLPGIPLAVARPDLRFTLLDATGKKVRFVQAAAATLGLDGVEAVHGRAEQLGRDRPHRGAYDLATCRAMGSVSEVLECTLPLVRVGGQVLMLKGGEAQEQLDAAADALALLGGGEVAVVEAYPPKGPSNRGGASVAPANSSGSPPAQGAPQGASSKDDDDRNPPSPAPPAPPVGREAGGTLVILSVTKARPTPRDYPRRPGVPRHDPL